MKSEKEIMDLAKEINEALDKIKKDLKEIEKFLICFKCKDLPVILEMTKKINQNK